MIERYDNLIYTERMNVLTTIKKLSESTAHDVLKNIKLFEQERYCNNNDLRNRMRNLEMVGGVLDIYHYMSDNDRLVPLLKSGLCEDVAKDVSRDLSRAECDAIYRFQSLHYHENPRLDEQRDHFIKEAGASLQELNVYINNETSIKEKVQNTSYTSQETANNKCVNDILSIPLDKESPASRAALHFIKCRTELVMSGMPEVIANTRIVDEAVKIEQAKEDDFVKGIDSISSQEENLAQ